MTADRAQADAYREQARWRKATHMVALLQSFDVVVEPHELLTYTDDEWQLLQAQACPWLPADAAPPSATTRGYTTDEYLRRYHAHATDTATVWPPDDEEYPT